MGLLLKQKNVRMTYGGLIFNLIPELRQRIPGEFLGRDLEQAVPRLEALLDSSPNPPRIPDRDPALDAALDEFRDQQPNIEGGVWASLKESGISHSDLEGANHFLGQGITAALSLGDVGYMGANLEWVEGLLDNYGSNHGSLEAYQRAYRDAAHRHLSPAGGPILAWLDQVVESTTSESSNN